MDGCQGSTHLQIIIGLDALGFQCADHILRIEAYTPAGHATNHSLGVFPQDEAQLASICDLYLEDSLHIAVLLLQETRVCPEALPRDAAPNGMRRRKRIFSAAYQGNRGPARRQDHEEYERKQAT